MKTGTMQLIRAGERHFSDLGWLKTYWLFSFSDYQDPDNVRWGSLRVFNDDVVEAGAGFPPHPHSEMEIVTIILAGELTHGDSMGSAGVIRSGEVQRMSAGRGLRHSEFNHGSEPVHFYQIWLHPGEAGLPPGYEQKRFDPSGWRNRLLPIASGMGHPGALPIHTDAAIYRCHLVGGHSLEHALEAGRRVFVYVRSGSLRVGDAVLCAGDQLRLISEGPLTLRGAEESEFILIESSEQPRPPKSSDRIG